MNRKFYIYTLIVGFFLLKTSHAHSSENKELSILLPANSGIEIKSNGKIKADESKFNYAKSKTSSELIETYKSHDVVKTGQNSGVPKVEVIYKKQGNTKTIQTNIVDDISSPTHTWLAGMYEDKNISLLTDCQKGAALAICIQVDQAKCDRFKTFNSDYLVSKTKSNLKNPLSLEDCVIVLKENIKHAGCRQLLTRLKNVDIPNHSLKAGIISLLTTKTSLAAPRNPFEINFDKRTSRFELEDMVNGYNQLNEICSNIVFAPADQTQDKDSPSLSPTDEQKQK